MIHGSIWNKIPRFALPVAATAILEQLFNASDVAVVGNFTGEAKTVSVAAVGANSPIISLIVNLFIGIALGTNVVIANAIGRNDRDTVRKTLHTSVLVAIFGGIFVAFLGEAAAAPLLGMLNVPEDVFPLALLYLRIYLIGMPVILLYNFEAAIFRSVGDTKTPLAALAFSGVLNVLLNLFFVAVLHMTVNGVAIATVISNAISSVLLFIKLRRTNGIIHLEAKELKIDSASLKNILRIGLPAGIQSAVFAVSNIVIQSAINSLGTVVMAASSAAYNIEIITYDILNSFFQACTTFVGQNVGAGEMKRCRRTLFLCLSEGIVTLSLAVALILLFGKTLLAFFNRDPEVVETRHIRLMMVMLSHTFSLFYEVMAGYLRGFGMDKIYQRINWNTTTCNGSMNSNRYLYSQLSRAICLAAYEKPVTVEEISISTGIPTMYIEDELKRLEYGDAVRKINSKYATDFIIFRLKDRKTTEAVSKEAVNMLSDKFEAMMKEAEGKISGIGFYGSDFGIGRLGYIIVPYLLRQKLCDVKNNRLKLENGPYPRRKDGGYGWFIVEETADESENCAEHNCGCNTAGNDSRHIYYYWISKYFDNGIYHNRGIRWMCANGIPQESADGIVAKDALTDEDAAHLIEMNLLTKTGDGYRLNFPSFTAEQFEEFVSHFNVADDEINDLLADWITKVRKSFESFVPKHLSDQINQYMDCYLFSIAGYVIDELICRGVLNKPECENPLVNGVFCVEGKYINP